MDEIKRIKGLLDEAEIHYSGTIEDEFKMESIQLVMLVALMEDEFDIEVPDEYLDNEKLNSIAKIRQAIQEIMES